MSNMFLLWIAGTVTFGKFDAEVYGSSANSVMLGRLLLNVLVA